MTNNQHNHTPGPWYNVNNSYVYARYPNKNGELIASVWCNNAGEKVGNAQLIAQAPTLKAENEQFRTNIQQLRDENRALADWGGSVQDDVDMLVAKEARQKTENEALKALNAELALMLAGCLDLLTPSLASKEFTLHAVLGIREHELLSILENGQTLLSANVLNMATLCA